MQLLVLGYLLTLQDKLVTTLSEVHSAAIFLFKQSKKNVLGLVGLKMEISLTLWRQNYFFLILAYPVYKM